MERIVERVDFSIPAQPRALRVCAYARVSTGKDAMLHSLSAQVSYYSKMIQSHVSEFDEKLWRSVIETVTVHADGRLTFKFQGGTEIDA